MGTRLRRKFSCALARAEVGKNEPNAMSNLEQTFLAITDARGLVSMAIEHLDTMHVKALSLDMAAAG